MSDINCIGRVCKKCGCSKPIDEFHRDRSRASGLNRLCKPCNIAATKAWAAANKERVRARDRQGRRKAWRAANRDEINARRRAARAADPVAARARSAAERARNPEKARAACAAWSAKNLDKVSAIKARRKAARLQATPAWANRSLVDAIYAACAQRRAAGEDLHVDHIIPLQSDMVCGLHVEHNLRLLPAAENQVKQAKLLDVPPLAVLDPDWLAFMSTLPC